MRLGQLIQTQFISLSDMPSTSGQIYFGSTLINDVQFNARWIRPSEWIAMPTITSTEQKVAALFLVGNNNSNFVAFRCFGNYTVNWGDGNVENVASGVTAKHNYVFSSLSASTEIGPVGSKRRQAMIVITPQAGQNLTSVSFDFKHSSLASTYTTPILEITLSAPNCTSLLIGSTTGNLRLLEQCTILSHNTTSMSNMFTGCSALQSVPLFITSSVTNMSNMFQSCISLQSVPLFNTSSVTNMTNMFTGCSALQSVPLFNTSSVTTGMSNMFNGCSALQSVPLFITSSVTSMSNMFQSCISLQSVPLFNTSSVTNMSNMFQSCISLQSVPLFNTSSVTNMSGMFFNCSALQSVPLFITSSVTNMSNMFQSCISLQSVPTLNCSNATAITLFALSCNGLKRCQATSIKGTVSFASCTLGATELNEIYTNLADLTALPTQTITVTHNYGTATDTPAIATAKNWTVVG
jgi:surface protein